MISISNLSKIYTKGGDVHIPALQSINLTIEDGDSVAVLGTSGSGKSSLLHILGGLDSDYTGEVTVNGTDIAERNLTTYRRFSVGTIFQQFYLIPTFTVLQNVLMPYRLSHPFQIGGGKDKAKQLLESVGLADRLDHTPNELSGGQLQRVAIARALINEPQILLADEPTGNLDTKTGSDVLNLLFRLNQEQNVTLIIVSHDTEVKNFVQRAVRLQDGQLVNEEV
ncbi:MAG: ABC transporter ATP-binding protein [Candidatus Paceibacteria bacterium]